VGEGTSLFVGSARPPLDVRRAVRALKKSDPKLDQLISEIGPCRLRREEMQDPYVALAEAIVYQQLNGKAAATIFSRLVAMFPSGLDPRAILATEEGALRAAGISRNKEAALRHLAEKRLDGTVPHLEALEPMEDEEIVTRLSSVRGVGRWTVEMLLLFRLGRPDILPAADYGIRKGFKAMLKKRDLPEPKEILARGERWRPHRSVASWYLWRASERADAAAKKPR
jgi:3-methyladenine DNA glycosylase/8-oxoguanine DNA glycosylase